jgi:hypothetical protein
MPTPPSPDPTLVRALFRVMHRVATIREHLELFEYEAVQLVRACGVTWEEIGETQVPPISRQAAAKRFSHPKPRRTSS